MRIAIPNKGRLCEPTIELLERAGIRVVDTNGRRLYGKTNYESISILFARAQDIPRYVESGAADAGITGLDMIKEKNADVEVVTKLKMGRCKVVLAVPEKSRIRTPSQLKGSRIATALVNVTKKYLEDKGIKAQVVELSGAVELAPYLGIADGIIDQLSTGTSLAVNNLRIVDTLFESTACFIANKSSLASMRQEIEEVKFSFEGLITAEEKRYVMANVTSDETLKRVIAVMPAMESPTVLKLAKEGEYAVHSVVDEKDLMSTVRKLKNAGAKDILVFGMGRVIL
ncbi:ATP phosphoribosyltransferase [Candidatus Micrarchaeota archaeon]|nr:ATP phosphoribosyltransferase [Candidatus Micrarchaeota archaeon]